MVGGTNLVPFCHLHLHDQYSQLDGYGTAKQYVDGAKRLGQTHLALTNHSNVDGLIEFQKACKKGGITPILGVELYIVNDLKIKDKSDKRYHITVLISSDTGLENVFKMLSIANLDGFYRKPRIDPNVLLSHREGLVFMSACLNSFVNMKDGLDLLLELRKTNPTFLEIMPHNIQEQKAHNQSLANISKLYGIPLVATNDCHYPLPQNAKAQEVLLAIQRKAKWNDPNRWKFLIQGLYLRSRIEMINSFKEQNALSGEIYLEAIEKTMVVAESCNKYKIKERPVILPKAYGTEDRDESELLWEIIAAGWEKRLDFNQQANEVYQNRVTEEYELICQQGFQRYFLIVWELINWCKKKGIMTGPGRGSVGGSLVAYLMGITDVEPIKYGLIFARFISPSRIDLPDIDMDFEDLRRGEVRQHLEQCYGHFKVAGVSTFMTMKGKGALRDVARVFEIPNDEADKASKALPDALENDPLNGITIVSSCKSVPEVIEFQRKYPEVVNLAIQLEGQIRGSGQHAAAICISSDDLREGKRCNFCNRSGNLVANWAKDYAEFMGMMKVDALGLSALTIINSCRKMIKKNYGENIDFNKISLDNKQVYEEISKGHTIGIFQFSGYSCKTLAKEMGVENFDRMAQAISLARPGPTDSGMLSLFVQRKKGASWVRKHRIYEEITKDTYGVLIYQEQVMEVIKQIAGLPYEVADNIRKIIGKKRDARKFEPYRIQFLEGCKEQKTFTDQEANDFWKGLIDWAGYGFNKSHACGYALLGYWTAWLKVFYPKEFMCSLLTYGEDKKKSLHVEEARRLGLEIVLPKIGISDASVWTSSPRENKIYAPFTEIVGVGPNKAEKITSTKSGNNYGFFKNMSGKGDSDLDKLLAKVGANLDRDLTLEEEKEARQFFKFSISKDKLSRYSSLKIDKSSLAVYNSDDLYHCNLSGHINLIEIRKFVRKIGECNDCELRKEARRPVDHSIGRYNLMGAGEAPGIEEDRLGFGFAGDAGNVLWSELKLYGITPQMIHITNINKCYPKITRTPNKNHIKACSRHISEEIQGLRPILILAFGNTGVKFFKGQDSGISDLSGSTEWSDKWGCWICWCIHPASILYQPKNKKDFQEGIENFANKVNIIGGNYLRQIPKHSIIGTCPYGGRYAQDNNNYFECETCPIWDRCSRDAMQKDWSR